MRTTIAIGLVIGSFVTMTTASAVSPQEVSSAQSLLTVRFDGTTADGRYRPAPGERVDGTLEVGPAVQVQRGRATVPEGDTALRFQPRAALTAGGLVTKNVVVEAVVRKESRFPHGDTLASVFGGAGIAYRGDYRSGDHANRLELRAATGDPVTAPARAVPSDRFAHVAVVYTTTGTGSSAQLYVDGCPTGAPVELPTPAVAAASAIGIGQQVRAGATGSAFQGTFDQAAVATFEGAFDRAMFQLTIPRPAQPHSPATIIPTYACDSAKTLLDKASKVVPDSNQRRWMDLETTGFVHFGINTFTGADGIEWGDGLVPPENFNPTEFDARQWAKAFKAAGMKLAILTGKHHDGFIMWQSRYSKYGVMASPWKQGKGDVVAEFVAAMRAEGIRVGLYVSPADINSWRIGVYNNGSPWRQTTIPTLVEGDDRADDVAAGKLPTFTVQADDFNRYYENQLYEVLSQYGPLDEVWFDGANPLEGTGTEVTQRYDFSTWYAMVRRLQPNAVIFGGPDIRWVGNEAGRSRPTEWSVVPHRGDQALDRGEPVAGYDGDDLGSRPLLGQGDFLRWFPAEADVSIRPGWFYHQAQDASVKSLDTLMSIYYASVGRNSNLLLNVPPDRRGLLHETDVRRLAEFGDAVRRLHSADLAAGATTTYDGNTRELQLPEPRRINTLDLAEDVTRGQRVERFALDAWVDRGWEQVVAGTTIGRRVLKPFQPLTTDRVRLRLLETRAEPHLTRVALRWDDRRTVPNLALGKPVAQSSTAYGGVPERAVDGDTNGSWGSGSVTHTEENVGQPWWRVDLGRSQQLGRVDVFNRTDCCGARLSDYYLLVSANPLSDSLAENLARSDVWVSHQTTQAGSPTTIPVGAAGRYVQVQLAGTGTLSLAEVQVLPPG